MTMTVIIEKLFRRIFPKRVTYKDAQTRSRGSQKILSWGTLQLPWYLKWSVFLGQVIINENGDSQFKTQVSNKK